MNVVKVSPQQMTMQITRYPKGNHKKYTKVRNSDIFRAPVTPKRLCKNHTFINRMELRGGRAQPVRWGGLRFAAGRLVTVGAKKAQKRFKSHLDLHQIA